MDQEKGKIIAGTLFGLMVVAMLLLTLILIN